LGWDPVYSGPIAGGPILFHCGVGFLRDTDSSSEKNQYNRDLNRECEKRVGVQCDSDLKLSYNLEK